MPNTLGISILEFLRLKKNSRICDLHNTEEEGGLLFPQDKQEIHMFLYVNCCKEYFSRFTINPQSVCVSIVTGIVCMQTVCSNEPAMLVLENLVFLLFGDFCGEILLKNFFDTMLKN